MKNSRTLSRGSSQLLFALLIVFALMLATTGLPLLAAQAQTTNLALNRPVTCSSIENGGTLCASAVDGNTGTRWSSAFSDPQWIQVDLGAAQSIGHVILRWQNSYGQSYQIQTSNDATNWTMIYSTTTGDGGIDDLTGLSGSGRYIRMYGTVRHTIYGYSLWEFEVYGASGSLTNTPTLTNTPVSSPLPDLTVLSITEFTYSVPTPTPNAQGCWQSGGGSAIGLRVTIQNIGTADAGSFVVGLLLDSTTYTRTVSGLPASQTLAVDFSPVPLPRTRTATVDSTGLVTESNETNNTFTLNLSAATNTPTGTPPPMICLTSTPTPTPTTPTGGTNLALNKPVTFSSQQAGNEASHAVDGDTATRWAASPWPQWIQVDLGTTYNISKTEIMPYASRAYQYRVEVSLDGTSYATVVDQTANTTGAATLTDTFATAAARYVRLTVTGASGYTGGWASVYEFRVFSSAGTPLPTNTPTQTNTPLGPTNTPTQTNTPLGPTNTPTQTNTPTRTPTATATSSGGVVALSYNAPAFASSSQDDAFCVACTPDKAVDMNNYTRWATAWSDPQWIYVDLGANATITRVVLNWQNAYGKAYQIQTSNDATNWTTIYSTTTGDGAVDDLTGLSGSGRYVRMYGTVRGTGYGYSLWAFDIYGTGGAPQATPTPAPTPTPHGPYTNLVWSDEFNGTSLDSTNWTLEVGGGGFGNNELEYYTNGQNLSFTGSEMIINVRQENPAGYTCWYGTCTYTSSRMKTAGKREFTYGRIEARIQVPYSQGLWPAFWMLGNDIGTVGWPNSGETDIMENIGKEPSTVHGTVHGPGYSGSNGLGGPYTLPSGQLHDAYHVYAVEWEGNVFRWYIDNILYFTLTKTTVETHGQWVFDHPSFILLNVAVGGAWPGNPDGTTVMPQQMKIDYIRVYQ